jgi:DNA-binding NtrC family response regulator
MTVPRILLVDDEKRFRTTLSKRLKERGLEVSLASCGVEALDMVKRDRFDVVVLDVKMPGLDGVATLSQIKRINPQVEVILLTGHTSVDFATEGLRLGAFEFMIKPCDIDELLKNIEEACLKGSRVGPVHRRDEQPDGPSS